MIVLMSIKTNEDVNWAVFTEDSNGKVKQTRLWRKRLRENELLIVGILAIIVLIIGLWGYSIYFMSLGETHSPLYIWHLTLQLFVLGTDIPGPIPLQLEVARFIAPWFMVYAGAKAIIALLHRQYSDFRARPLHQQHAPSYWLARCFAKPYS